ncbi:MAG: hypothetical protein FJX78_07485 [Armatimonadetes bacterium]|nr:hypothetical protein [Armatimonadota bacterium]
MPYRRLDNRPAPRYGLQEIQSLVDEKALFKRTDDYLGHRQDKCIALREADLKAFTADEIAIVDAHIHDFWDKSAKQISERSHDPVGWRSVDEKQDIPWEMALLSDEKLQGLNDSERERIEKYLDDVLANRASQEAQPQD